MTDTATPEQTESYSADLNIDGANVFIRAQSLDLLAALIAKFRAGNALPPATETKKSGPKSTVQLAKESRGVSADEKAAVLGNAPSPQVETQSAAPAAAPSPATTPAAVSGDVTQDMVNKATIALVQKHGADKAKGILTSFGLAKASEATAKCPDKFAEIHNALTAALEG